MIWMADWPPYVHWAHNQGEGEERIGRWLWGMMRWAERLLCGVRVSVGGKGCYPIGKPAVGPSLVFTEGLVVGSFGVCFWPCCW